MFVEMGYGRGENLEDVIEVDREGALISHTLRIGQPYFPLRNAEFSMI